MDGWMICCSVVIRNDFKCNMVLTEPLDFCTCIVIMIIIIIHSWLVIMNNGNLFDALSSDGLIMGAHLYIYKRRHFVYIIMRTCLFMLIQQWKSCLALSCSLSFQIIYNTSLKCFTWDRGKMLRNNNNNNNGNYIKHYVWYNKNIKNDYYFEREKRLDEVILDNDYWWTR